MHLTDLQRTAHRQAAVPGKKARPHGKHAQVHQRQPGAPGNRLARPQQQRAWHRDRQGHHAHPADDPLCPQRRRDLRAAHIAHSRRDNGAHQGQVGPLQRKALRMLRCPQQRKGHHQTRPQTGKQPEPQPRPLVQYPCGHGGRGEWQQGGEHGGVSGRHMAQGKAQQHRKAQAVAQRGQ